ncbi:hypothetical protein MBANPS3_009854 [Mucor bainieri]
MSQAELQERVRVIINNIRAMRSQRDLRDADHIWSCFTGDHYKLLYRLLHNGTDFNPEEFSNVLVEEDPNRASSSTSGCTFYIRCANLTWEELNDSLNRYHQQYYADEDWVKKVREHCRYLVPSDEVTLFYCGITLSSTALDRLRSDNVGIINNSLLTRFGNFNKASSLSIQWRGYRVKGLLLPDIPDNVEQVKALGYIEDILIKAAGTMSLNSANGGFLCDFQIDQHTRDLCTDFLTSDMKFVSKQHVEPSEYLDTMVFHHFIHYVEFLNNTGFHKKIIMNDPRNRLINCLTNQSLCFGQVKTVLVGKDITDSALLNQVPYFSNEYAFHGPTFHREIFDTIHDMVQTAQENRAYRAFVDLFGTARKLQVQVAIPFLSRYLVITRPSIICSYSSVVYGAFALSLFNDFWNRIDQTAFENNYNAFHSCTNYPENMAQLLGFTDGAANLKCVTIKQNAVLWRHLGKASLCCYGPNQDDFCLLFPSRHTGYLKYDPIIQMELCYDSFFTHVFLEKLEAMLAANLEDQGINDPMDLDTAARKIFYRKLCQEFNIAIEKSSLWEPYQDNNKAIENHYIFVARLRQQAKLKRRSLGQPPEAESDTGSTNDEDDMGASGGEDDDEDKDEESDDDNDGDDNNE